MPKPLTLRTTIEKALKDHVQQDAGLIVGTDRLLDRLCAYLNKHLAQIERDHRQLGGGRINRAETIRELRDDLQSASPR